MRPLSCLQKVSGRDRWMGRCRSGTRARQEAKGDVSLARAVPDIGMGGLAHAQAPGLDDAARPANVGKAATPFEETDQVARVEFSMKS